MFATVVVRVLLVIVFFSPVSGAALTDLFAQTNSTSSANTPTHLVRGQVVSALDGSPLPRALVILNTRSALTDYQGHFEFAGIDGTNAFVSVRKPGFSANSEAFSTNATQRLTDLDTPILLRLYPDALVVGTLTARDGAPLSHVQVRLLRSQFDGSAIRWMPVGFGQTNARGEYRISAPAGRCRLVSSFVQQSFETGETILPASFPESSQSNRSTQIELHSGEEKHIDLRARVGPVYPFLLHVEPNNPQRGNLRVAVSTSTGDEFFTGLSSDQHLELPSGTYALRVQVDSREESMSGSSSVTVTRQDSPTTIVHLAPDTQLSVELLLGTQSTSSKSPNTPGISSLPEIPNVQQFNLLLHNQLAGSESQEQDIRLRVAGDKSSSFRVPPGRYRLAASGGGQWHVQSATLGATDLLADELVVGSGTGGGTIRLLVSNQSGTVHAHTSLPAGDTVWMYLVPRGPSLIPINPILLAADGAGGSTATASVPAGPYTALLMRTRLEEDPRDPAFLASFVSGPTDIEVQPNADTSFSLSLAKRKETEQ